MRSRICFVTISLSLVPDRRGLDTRMRSLVKSDWEPGTNQPSDGLSLKCCTRNNRSQVQVNKNEDKRTCNHKNQVCCFMEQRFEPCCLL